MKSLETKIPPPVLLMIFMILMWAVARLQEQPIFVPIEFRRFGFLGICAGLLIFALSANRFRRANTTIDPIRPGSASNLVTGGIFSLTRNPMYVAMIFVLIGWAVYLGVAVPVLLIPGFFGYMTIFQIIPEERALTAKFGDSYVDYKKRVRRWI